MLICIDLESSSDDDAPLVPTFASPPRKFRRLVASKVGLGPLPTIDVDKDALLARKLQDKLDAQYARIVAQELEDTTAVRRSPGRVFPTAQTGLNAACSSSPSAGVSVASRTSAVRICSSLSSGPVVPVASLPDDLLSRSAPEHLVYGTPEHPILVLKNVDGQRGRLLAGHVLYALGAAGMRIPEPVRGKRGAIVADWHRSKRSRTPWSTGIRVLSELAPAVLHHLRQNASVVHRVPALALPDRAWNDSEIIVTTPGCKLRRHRDAQPPGSLLLIFCAGLSCQSDSWPRGVPKVEVTLESGDVMLMDGKRVEHAVPHVYEGSSPFAGCWWLGSRRLSVLVRQVPPPPACLKQEQQPIMF